MIEIRDTFRSGEDAERGEQVWGGGVPLSIRLSGLGEHPKLLQRGLSENGFCAF